MKRCEKCSLNVDNPIERCPLCYTTLAELDGQPELNSYPLLQDQAEGYHLIYRILLFLSITAAGICLTVNILTYNKIWWALIVIANILYMWIAIGTATRPYAKLGHNVMVQVISLAPLLVVIDYFAGDNRWAVNYALPILFITATLSMTIIVIVKRMDIGSFVLYFLLIALLGFIPIILWALRISSVFWPALVSALYSAMSLVSIFIFADNATKIELKKRFHI